MSREVKPAISRYLVFAPLRSLHSESSVGLNTLLLYPHRLCSSVSARIADSDISYPVLGVKADMQRYKTSTMASGRDVNYQQHSKVYAIASSRRKLFPQNLKSNLP
jgi:hypothetical protein